MEVRTKQEGPTGTKREKHVKERGFSGIRGFSETRKQRKGSLGFGNVKVTSIYYLIFVDQTLCQAPGKQKLNKMERFGSGEQKNHSSAFSVVGCQKEKK